MWLFNLRKGLKFEIEIIWELKNSSFIVNLCPWDYHHYLKKKKESGRLCVLNLLPLSKTMLQASLLVLVSVDHRNLQLWWVCCEGQMLSSCGRHHTAFMAEHGDTGGFGDEMNQMNRVLWIQTVPLFSIYVSHSGWASVEFRVWVILVSLSLI